VREDGSLGLCSGWLTKHAAIGDSIDLRIRRNAGFHPPADGRPLLLVGNGTGLAGLRALLKARIAAGHHRNWLVFGERNAAVDAFHGGELEAWHAAGQLERLDRVWSRDGGACRYVQDRLRECAAGGRAGVEQGADIYVCGSLEGMTPGVHAALIDALGEDTLERLTEEGRYRRDVDWARAKAMARRRAGLAIRCMVFRLSWPTAVPPPPPPRSGRPPAAAGPGGCRAGPDPRPSPGCARRSCPPAPAAAPAA